MLFRSQVALDRRSDSESEFEENPPHRNTMSEFLRQCVQPNWVIEEEEEELVPPPEFDAHFLAHPPLPGPHSNYHIPVLCMADEERLPLLMSALLHQRRIWHIDDPLIGIQFSTYSTTISLFVGWLEREVGPGCVLVGAVISLAHALHSN